MEAATVLVVDDDPALRDVLGQLLEDDGYHPLMAGDGREAISYFEAGNHLPDVMLLDLVMPDVDGYQVLQHMRENLLQDFPVLIFSAQRPDPSMLETLDSELRDFIAKPFELEELVIRMQRLMQRSPRMAESGTGCLRVYALGSLKVYRDEVLLFDETWRNKPARTIFKMLFTQRDRRYPKDVLIEEIWPETDPGIAANRLRVAIHELRKMLGDSGSQSKERSCIGQQEGSYFFDPDSPCWSDVDSFQEYAQMGRTLAGEGKLDDVLHAYRNAEAIYQGDYLRDDPFFEWSVSLRERLRELHLSMLGDAARIHSLKGEYEESAGFCRKILRVEPWREEVYRHLMEYLAAAGRRHEALRAFEECRRSLQAEIEAEPSAETVALRNQIAEAAPKATEAIAES